MKLLSMKSRLLLLFLGTFAVAYAQSDKRMVSSIVPPINQPATGQKFPGKFVWHDLFTDKLKESMDFYKGLFGWDFRKFGPGKRAYYYITNEGLGVGGITQLKENEGKENQWVSYISVDSVKTANNDVIQRGGKVLVSPRIFHQIGEVAIFADPEGAAFGVIDSESGDQREVLPEEGQWLWADLFAANPKAQTGFYNNITHYTVKDNRVSAEPDNYFLLSNSVPRAGVLPLPAEDVLPNWISYVRVSDIKQSIMKVAQLGGRVLLQPSTRIFDGRLAIISDPGGAVLGVIEISE